ncbi:hypothetical protein [Noviherbaspirillum sp.]|jgi:hypothetical protein|uniref:hypothetical protein n=1 Tax=Noviherbaspirillum sp. TaxID=1926288 RepID=UPI002600F09E|nr:hypothetical protein [Noviherbaspirillum sp.]
MSPEQVSMLNSLSPRPGLFGSRPEEISRQISAAPPTTPTASTEKTTSLLGEHGGKLAVGAAAMLGLAIFYKWRESQLAKNDPEEYARLQRLKAVIANGKARSTKKTRSQQAARNESQ